MHLDSISNTCLPPPNSLFYTQTQTHTHTRIHQQRHLLWFLLYSGTRQRGGAGRVIIILFMPGGGFHCILFWVHLAVRPHTFLFQTKTRKKDMRRVKWCLIKYHATPSPLNYLLSSASCLHPPRAPAVASQIFLVSYFFFCVELSATVSSANT